MAETIFSKIVRGEIPCDKVYEDNLSLAFRDINPQAPVHILIIPKKDLEDISKIDTESGLLEHLIRVANQIAVSEGIAESGYRLVVNKGAHGGQTVNHLHIHLLGGRPLTWPPG
ncbi:MAG: histidine triad nucleotide-binding protein [Candidatus Omnitrophica bacterium]|nr:MAG: HIT-like protein [Candidatus Hinthialibacteria bacterium OLB16]MCC6731931.1 histidine triad nucleotide-binding protein [Candidatus Omnitrophota bacterium]MCK6495290.1 histidine triad nucleotide-binding protein [bacterium]MCL4735610.1 histidine triad nucleotide-binding protein [Candidatus Omnitrophota bacterium]NUP91479.1 histidine triad nucleotide-binding protein [Candidatus Omnitrophota bacterium]